MDLQLHHQLIALHFSFLTIPWLRYRETSIFHLLVITPINAKIFTCLTERGSTNPLFYWIDTNGYLIHYGTHPIHNKRQFFTQGTPNIFLEILAL